MSCWVFANRLSRSGLTKADICLGTYIQAAVAAQLVQWQQPGCHRTQGSCWAGLLIAAHCSWWRLTRRLHCCLVAVCGHHPIQLWDRAESMKALQPGRSCNPVLLQLVSRLSRGDYPQRILCTGVSTGGSLAALAALWAVVTYPAAQVRLITFGAPPVSPSVQRHERVARICSQPGCQACCPRAWHVWQDCTALHGRADQLQQQPALPCAGCSVCNKAVVPPASSAPANRRRPPAPFCSIHRTAPTLALLTCQILHLHYWL